MKLDKKESISVRDIVAHLMSQGYEFTLIQHWTPYRNEGFGTYKDPIAKKLSPTDFGEWYYIKCHKNN